LIPEATCEALAAAGGADDVDQARIEAATRRLADCDERLAKYRKALDADADPVEVAGWMSEVQGERDIAEARPSGRLSVKQVRELVASLQDVASVLATADPKVKAAIYDELGITVSYDWELESSRPKHGLTARVQLQVSEGGLEPPRPCGHQPLKLARLPIPPLRRVCDSDERSEIVARHP
jgi:hypothetical protein